jgi:TetR/AcrR family transcriptional regulator, regulator of biofilm formation and stress response
MPVTTPGKRSSTRRAGILEATLRVIASRGADGVTHRAVALEAGVPAASTTYYFDSKEALVEEALELVIDRSTALVRRHAEGAPPAGPAELVDRLVDLVALQVTDREAPLAAQYELMLEAGRRERLRPLAERWETIYMAALTALVAGAGLPRPQLSAEILADAMEGALLGQLALPRDDFIDGHLRPQLDRLVNALA